MEKFLEEKKFTKSHIKFIDEKVNSLGLVAKKEDLKNFIGFLLLTMKYSPKEIKQMIKMDPFILTITSEDLKRAIEDFTKLGYSMDNIKNMFLLCPSVVMIPIELIKDMIAFLIDYGFTKKQILNFTSHEPAFYKFSIPFVNKKLAMLERLTFSKKQRITLVTVSPTALKDSEKDFLDSIDFLQNFNFTLEEAIHLLTYLSDRIRSDKAAYAEKLGIVVGYGFKHVILDRPMDLLQGQELTNARISFFESEEIPIAGTTKYQIFYCERNFKSIYGRSNKQLIESYRLRTELDNKRNCLLPKGKSETKKKKVPPKE